MGRDHINPVARWNSGKCLWEVLIEEAQGDRYAKVFRPADVAHKMLKDQGIKFVEVSTEYKHRSMMLITDWDYWLDNGEVINKWFAESNLQYSRSGMILEFDTREDKMMFMLRWA
jgi:hypothetical protein